MTSYKLVTGEKPEPYTPDNPMLHGLVARLMTHWDELVVKEAPPADEWECTDAIRDMTRAHMAVLAEDNEFNKEKIRLVPFMEDSLLKFKVGTQSKYLDALLSEEEAYIRFGDSCSHYLIFRKRKIVEEKRKQKREEFIEHYYW